jgi:hypothetical protein
MPHIIAIGFLLLLLSSPRIGAAASNIGALNSDVLRTATEYRDQLMLQLKLEDLEVYRRQREVDSRTQMLDKGYISKSEMEQSRTALARAQEKLADTKQRINDAEMIIGEAEVRNRLASLPPLALGGYSESGDFVRYNGPTEWTLADAGKIETYFQTLFGHPLPVSARGESDVHRQMHFDHRNAMDVAIHPDSIEGRALMDYLRKSGIPFLAFRGKIAGSSTGAHIHIGKPSMRVASPIRAK